MNLKRFPLQNEDDNVIITTRERGEEDATNQTEHRPQKYERNF